MWKYPIPKNWQLFEQILADWAQNELSDTGADRYGRSGQRQHGIDILARNRKQSRQGAPEIWAIQAKRYEQIAVSPAIAQADLEQALSHSPRPDVFILATTTPRDAKLQDWAVLAHPIRVEVWFWDSLIERFLNKSWFRSKYLAGFWQKRVPMHLQPPPLDFTGRDSELSDLVEKVRCGENILLISGMGGVGKTVFALALAERIRERYQDGQLRVDLHGLSPKESLSATDVMLRVIRSYEPNFTAPKASDELIGEYRTLIQEKRILILLDNARDADQLKGLTPTPNSCLLVTARQRISLAGGYNHKVDILRPLNSSRFLIKLCSRVESHAAEISELCGHLPLSLRLAGTVMEERVDLAVHEYVAQLREERIRRDFVDATIDLSYRLLPDQLRDGWRLLAVFRSPFDISAAAEVLCQSQRIASDTLGGLLKHNMIEWDTTLLRYSTHELLRLVAQSRLSETESQTARLRHAKHYEKVLRSIREKYRTGNKATTDALHCFDHDKPHVEAAVAWLCTMLEQGDDYRRLCSSYLYAGNDIFPLRIDSEKLVIWLEAAVAASRTLNDRLRIKAHLGNLGSALAGAANYKAAASIQEEALAMARADGDAKGITNSLGNLPSLYLEVGEYSKCIDFAKQSLQIEQLIGNKKGMAADLNTLGGAYYRIGERDKALEMYSQSLSLKNELGDRLGIANSMASIGSMSLDDNEFEAAVTYLSVAVNIFNELGYNTREEKARGWLCLAVLGLGPIKNLTESRFAELQAEQGAGKDPLSLARRVIEEMRVKAKYARKEGKKK